MSRCERLRVCVWNRACVTWRSPFKVLTPSSPLGPSWAERSALLDVSALSVSSLYLGDLSCRVQCSCETLRVCARTGNRGSQNSRVLQPWPLPCVCIYSEPPSRRGHVYASCCGVSLGHHYLFFFCLLFFCVCVCVYRYDYNELKSSWWRPPPTPPICAPPTPRPLSLSSRGKWRTKTEVGLSTSGIRTANPPVGCVFRW